MRFTVALDLGGLDEGLEAHAKLRIRSCQRIARESLHREHPAVAQIAVMRDRQDFGTRIVLEGCELLPKIFRKILVARHIARQGGGIVSPLGKSSKGLTLSG